MHQQPESAEINVARVPLWARGAIKHLAGLIADREKPVKVLEFGSGGSTIFLLKQGAEVTSVEHHPGWAESLQAKAASLGLGENLRLLLRDRPYANVVESFARGTTFDILLVDGRERVDCLKAALPLVAPDGLVLLDDAQRSRYWPAFRALAHVRSTMFEDRARSTVIWDLASADQDQRFVAKTFPDAAHWDHPRPGTILVPDLHARSDHVGPGYILRKPLVENDPTIRRLRQLGYIAGEASYTAPHVFRFDNPMIRIDQGRKFVAHRGAVYTNGAGEPFTVAKKPPPFGKVTPLSGLTLDLSAPGAGRFAFFLLSSLPKLDLIGEIGLTLEDIDHILINSGAPWARSLVALACKGKAPDIVAFSQRTPAFGPERMIGFESVRAGRFTPAWVYDFLDRVFAGDADPAQSENLELSPRVYISRQRAQGRRIVNHEEVMKILKPLGFQEVFAEDHPPQVLASALRKTEVLLSPHGAGLANLIFCPANARIIELFGSHYTPQYYYLARDRGQSYSSVPCMNDAGKNALDYHQSAVGEREEINREDIVVPLDVLEAALSG
ncbi:glycosyltransferase 61 family protein [Histidinibacterium lentulum]|uniref:DUF563 domain-containing protein n=1 Tax=Histidinibacterium lentulum TaxID=2480588 RepID=A0A3N2R664_9RHOB|nr:glycosyltransferase 61 family protein [Histidinibacterium lentulum]ROU02985.1 DUF563 domain-containing protein [Histidinibacterium lentulum]